MTNSKDIIIKLKEVRAEKGLSYADIIKIMEEKGIYPVSTATLSRIFSENSEETNFNYETTLRPIAEALLDIDTIEDTDLTIRCIMYLSLKQFPIAYHNAYL